MRDYKATGLSQINHTHHTPLSDCRSLTSNLQTPRIAFSRLTINEPIAYFTHHASRIFFSALDLEPFQKLLVVVGESIHSSFFTSAGSRPFSACRRICFEYERDFISRILYGVHDGRDSGRGGHGFIDGIAQLLE